MEITIEKIFESGDQLRVIVEHPYGKDNIGLGLQAKYLDPETGNPRWQREVKELIEKKYGKRLENNAVQKVDCYEEWHGKKCKLDDLHTTKMNKK